MSVFPAHQPDTPPLSHFESPISDRVSQPYFLSASPDDAIEDGVDMTVFIFMLGRESASYLQVPSSKM